MNRFRYPPAPAFAVYLRAARGDPLADIEIHEYLIEHRRTTLRLQNSNALMQATILVALFPANVDHAFGRFVIAFQVVVLVLILWLRQRVAREIAPHPKRPP